MLLGFQLRVSVLGLVIWSSRGSIGYIGVTRFPVEAEVEISKKGCPSSLMVIQDLGGHEVLEVLVVTGYRDWEWGTDKPCMHVMEVLDDG
jgi:hypothetical protein